MQIRFQNSPNETKKMTTAELRENFLIDKLMEEGKVNLVYSHYDRVIVGGAMPLSTTIELANHEELRADYFLQRREIGIINVGGKGSVTAGDKKYELNKLDALYISKGTEKVSFASDDAIAPAVFYLLSSPAHRDCETRLMKKEETSPVDLGTSETANKRRIYKYIHADGIQSCQLVMGLTILAEGSVWNTMPAHTHTRRMEAYFYFDVPDEHRVIHFMGEPKETRHLVMANHEAVVSPPWSIHAGCGTANYGFIWGMAGENYNYTDMDPAPITEML